MTPAEELRAAAAKLREMAAAADTPGSWKANPLFRPLPGCRCLSCEEDKPWAWEIDVVGVGEVELRLLHVLRDVDEDRPLPPRARDVERRLQHSGKFFDILNQP